MKLHRRSLVTLAGLSLSTLVTLAPATAQAQGTVQNLTFFSNALGVQEQFQIYLPEGYDPTGIRAVKVAPRPRPGDTAVRVRP